VYYTGGSLNPTRSFGPAVAATQFPGCHWIYWVWPFLGGALAAGYYRLVKYLNYEEANPGEDSTDGNFSEYDKGGLGGNYELRYGSKRQAVMGKCKSSYE
jgi:hypothetical protein